MNNPFRSKLEQVMYPGSTDEDYSIQDFTSFIILNMDLTINHLRFMYSNNTPIDILDYRFENTKKWEYRLWINPDNNCFKIEQYDGPTYDTYCPKHIFTHIIYLMEKNGLKLKVKTMTEFFKRMNDEFQYIVSGGINNE